MKILGPTLTLSTSRDSFMISDVQSLWSEKEVEGGTNVYFVSFKVALKFNKL